MLGYLTLSNWCATRCATARWIRTQYRYYVRNKEEVQQVWKQAKERHHYFAMSCAAIGGSYGAYRGATESSHLAFVGALTFSAGGFLLGQAFLMWFVSYWRSKAIRKKRKWYRRRLRKSRGAHPDPDIPHSNRLTSQISPH